jgi:hypothetical protein
MSARAPDSRSRNAAETDKRTNGEQTGDRGRQWWFYKIV